LVLEILERMAWVFLLVRKINLYEKINYYLFIYIHKFISSLGKLALYTACAGIRPENCLPVLIDVGTNTASIREDKAYLGLRTTRDRSSRYDELIDEFFTAAKEVYGRNVLIQVCEDSHRNIFVYVYRSILIIVILFFNSLKILEI
jgi:hypothetical protein